MTPRVSITVRKPNMIESDQESNASVKEEVLNDEEDDVVDTCSIWKDNNYVSDLLKGGDGDEASWKALSRSLMLLLHAFWVDPCLSLSKRYGGWAKSWEWAVAADTAGGNDYEKQILKYIMLWVLLGGQ